MVAKSLVNQKFARLFCFIAKTHSELIADFSKKVRRIEIISHSLLYLLMPFS